MKCIKFDFSKAGYPAGSTDYRRVSNERAAELVRNDGWEYCSKTEYKHGIADDYQAAAIRISNHGTS